MSQIPGYVTGIPRPPSQSIQDLFQGRQTGNNSFLSNLFSVDPITPAPLSGRTPRNANIVPSKGRPGVFGDFLSGLPDDVASAIDLLNTSINDAVEKETTARREGEGILGQARTGVDERTSEQLQAIGKLNEFIKNQFDPVKSQFQQFIDTEALSDTVREGLLSNIRNQFANALTNQRQNIGAQLAARGLGTSSIAERGQREALTQNLSGRLGAETELNARAAELNRRLQQQALSGLAGTTATEAQLLSSNLGQQTGLVGDQNRLNAILAGQQADIRAGQQFPIKDFTSALGLADADQLINLARQQFEFETSPEGFGQAIGAGVAPFIIERLLSSTFGRFF